MPPSSLYGQDTFFSNSRINASYTINVGYYKLAFHNPSFISIPRYFFLQFQYTCFRHNLYSTISTCSFIKPITWNCKELLMFIIANNLHIVNEYMRKSGAKSWYRKIQEFYISLDPFHSFHYKILYVEKSCINSITKSKSFKINFTNH